MSTISQDVEAPNACALSILRVAAGEWAAAEREVLRKQGLDRWATPEPTCFAHWSGALLGASPGAQAHLTLQLADEGASTNVPYRLVWQIALIDASDWGVLAEQTELAVLNDFSDMGLLLDGVDTILSLDALQVLGWARQVCERKGFSLILQPRH